MTTTKLPISLDNLLHQHTVESERIEYKAGWNPESVVHTLSTLNDFPSSEQPYTVTRCTSEMRLK